MSILRTYFSGLIVIHFAWLYFFTTGHLVRRRSDDRRYSLDDLVITSVAGMAIAGFGLVFLGFIHFLNILGIAILLLFEGVLFWWLGHGNWLSIVFWRTTLRRMCEAWTAPAVFVYVILLAAAPRAVLPPTFADSVTYHLAYAVEWAMSGRIHIDPFLRFPFYANNFLLLYSASFVLKLSAYCQFLPWLCGLLTCLGILAFVTDTSSSHPAGPFWKRLQPQEFLVPLCLVLSPIFLRYLNVGLMDVPIGLFVLIPILCAYRSSPDRPYERELIIVGAFCTGMKLTLIGDLPLFIGSLFFATARRLRRQQIVWLALTLIALSLPWYMRNLIETHDPFPPLLNSYFHRIDPIFSSDGALVYTTRALTAGDPLSILLVPFRFFLNPASGSFAELGVSTLILLLYGPILFLIAQVCWRHKSRLSMRLTYLSIAVVYLILPWLFTSLGRYSLHWYPVLVAWAGVLVTHSYAWLKQRCHSSGAFAIAWASTVVFCCALVLPTPIKRCLGFYGAYYSDLIAEETSNSKKVYLARHVRGYLESEAVIETLANNDQRSSRVLVFGRGTPAYYFRQQQIKSVGDYFGPARFSELVSEIRGGDCEPYLDRLHISAIIIDPDFEAKGWYRFFLHELAQDHFVEYRYGNDSVPVFLKSEMVPARGLTRVIPDSIPHRASSPHA
jgi:hypothetical protein